MSHATRPTVRRVDADSSRLGHPYRPRLIAALNRVGAALERAGIGGGAWRAEELMDEASRATGLHDFGDPSFLTPLRVLLDSIHSEARLNPVGRMITRGRLAAALRTRLRAEAMIAAHPEILQIPIEAPIFIAGLQRTGTTMLHRLLAEDPALRALRSWEALDPVPGRLPSFRGDDPRVFTALLAERGLRYMAPEFFAIHPVEARAPEEDVILLDLAFLSTVPEATLHVPTYSAWLEKQDQAPAYRYLRRMLQILMYGAPPGRWVLKTPHHLEWLDTLLQVFPDARVIQTHRDPLKTIASFSSMITHGRGVFSDEVDPHEVGAHWSRKIYRMVERAMDVRDRAPKEQFLDVAYADLMKDPVAEIERVYAFTGLSLTPPVRARIATAREASPQHKYGRHSYRLDDFGLDRAEVEARVARYRARHSIVVEGAPSR